MWPPYKMFRYRIFERDQKHKIQNDSMKKLIEKYAEMENVIPEAIQLIFKGNPVTKDDTPNKLEITSEDILEVCKVPGIFIPAKKPSTPSPADMDESSKLCPFSTKFYGSKNF